MLIKFKTEQQAGEIVERLLRYARLTTDNFVMGPFNKTKLMSEGLTVEGDLAGVRTVLKKYSSVTLEVIDDA